MLTCDESLVRLFRAVPQYLQVAQRKNHIQMQLGRREKPCLRPYLYHNLQHPKNLPFSLGEELTTCRHV